MYWGLGLQHKNFRETQLNHSSPFLKRSILLIKNMEKQKVRKCLKNKIMGVSQRGHRSQPEIAPISQSWDNSSHKINNIVLDYNPKCKINAYECMLIDISDCIHK